MGNLRSISLICSLIALFSFNSAAQTTDLIISEYAEGSSFNKYIEVYNGTGADVDLTDYVIKVAFNGSTSWSTTVYNLTGTLANDDVYVMAHSSADASILTEADFQSGGGWFNGNDVVGLFSSSSIIDRIGVLGENPGDNKGWAVAGIANATCDHTLVRKSTVCTPTTDWALSAGTSTVDSQWDVYAINTWDYLGSHTSTCGGVPVPINAIWLILLFASSAIVIKKLVK